MKNRHLKKVALFLVVVMVATCLASCGKKTEVATKGSPVTYNGDKIYP